MITEETNKCENGLEKFVVIMFFLFIFLIKFAWDGLRSLRWGKLSFYLNVGLWYLVCYLIAHHAFHLRFIESFGDPNIQEIANFFYGLGEKRNFHLILSFSGYFYLVFKGVAFKAKKKKDQAEFDALGLKTPNQERAKVLSVKEQSPKKKEVLFQGAGLTLTEIKSKKENFESIYQLPFVDVVQLKGKDGVFKALLEDEKIKKFQSYEELQDTRLGDYSFVVGAAKKDEIITQNIRSLPHMMISGSTDSGKSNFFHLTLYQILRNNPRTRLYFLDLKNGVEARPYRELPNTKVAKTEEESLLLLKEIHLEMKKRFEFLEKENIEKVHPKTNKLDLIILAIDEASVLFGKRDANSSKKEVIDEARELAEEVAKLGRAASIHMIAATQKVIKETLDTRIQENIAGRMCFRTESAINSRIVLNNDLAFNLPGVKGRGIWKVGINCKEVQVPFLDREELKARLKELKEELSCEDYQNKGVIYFKGQSSTDGKENTEATPKEFKV